LSFTFLYSKFLEHDLLDPRGREREGGVEGVCRPSEGRAAGVVELELAITVVDGGCTRAAAFGEEKQ
jgi:hypothetical protein